MGNAKLEMFLYSVYLSWNILQQNITRKRISRENGKNGKKRIKVPLQNGKRVTAQKFYLQIAVNGDHFVDFMYRQKNLKAIQQININGDLILRLVLVA